MSTIWHGSARSSKRGRHCRSTSSSPLRHCADKSVYRDRLVRPDKSRSSRSFGLFDHTPKPCRLRRRSERSLPQPAGTVRADAEVQTRAGCEGGGVRRWHPSTQFAPSSLACASDEGWRSCADKRLLRAFSQPQHWLGALEMVSLKTPHLSDSNCCSKTEHLSQFESGARRRQVRHVRVLWRTSAFADSRAAS